VCGSIALAAWLLSLFCPALQAEGLRDRLKGLVYEVEEYTEPKDAWLVNRNSPNKWNLWSTEADAINKRSGGQSLQSPRVEKDRATPEEGAPPLHTRITGIPRGTYRVFASPPNRRIAISFDGKNWEMRHGGEIDLGVWKITDGTFELWVDDRYADPTNIGSCYYDYIRFEEFTPPRLSHFAIHRVVEPYERVLGAGVHHPDAPLQLSWMADQPVPTGTVEYGTGGRFDQRAESAEISLRNHRVLLKPLAPGRYQGRVRIPFGQTEWTSPPFEFTVPAPVRPGRSRAYRVPLTLLEPTAAGRKAWPVTSGIPLPKGVLASAADARIEDSRGRPVPSRCVVTSAWPDGSARWLVVTFLADTEAGKSTRYTLVCGGRQPGQAAAAPPIRVLQNTAEDGFALFRDLALDLNGNGIAEPDEIFSGEPELGNLRLLDAAQRTFGMAPGAKVRSFRNALRHDVISEGHYAGPEGEAPFRWRAEMTAFAGQPWMRLRFSVANPRIKEPHTLLSGVGLTLPIAGTGSVEGAFEEFAFQRVGEGETPVLLQDLDDHFSIRGQGSPREGERALGFASVRRDGKCLTAFVRDFWQTYPKALALKSDGLHVRLLPLLPPNAYEKESADGDALIRLFYPYRNGKYQFNRGLEFMTELYLLLEQGAAPGQRQEMSRYAQWFNNPLYAVPDPMVACATGALGPVSPRVEGEFDAYTHLVEKGFAAIEERRQEKREYGWLNYGDWHGERRFNWGNLEYDLQWALGLEFLRSGSLKYLWRGAQAAQHSVTIDTVYEPWSSRMAGLQWTHSVGHIGNFFDRNDDRFRKFGNVFGLSRPDAPNPFVAGAIDVAGHTFVGGNFLYAMLLGDPRMLQVTERVATHQAAYLTPSFDFSIERAAGWPLINAVEAYETTGNPFYLNAARLYVEKVLAKQDPEIGDFRLRHGPPECMHEPRHIGGKAFATGVLLYGLMRYHLLTDDPEVKRCILRSASWLARTSWNKETHAFRYLSTCPTFGRRRGNGSTDLLCAPGMAYALTLKPDPEVREVLLDSLSRAFAAHVDNGKGYAGMIRQTPYALHLLREKLGVRQIQPPAGSLGASVRPVLYVPLGESAPLHLIVTREASLPETCRVRVTSAPRGWKIEPRELAFRAPIGTSASPALQVRAEAGAKPGEVVLSCTMGNRPAGDLRVRLMPRAPAVTGPAPDAAGLAVLGPSDTLTAQAFSSRPGVRVGIAPEEMTRYRAVVLPCDFFASGSAKPEALLEQLSAFARGGGTVVLFQLNDDIWQPGFLPIDLMLSDTNGELGSVDAPEHPLFAGVGNLDKVICYDTITYADPGWKVLARDTAGQPAILEAAIGQGRILVIEPSLDRIAAGKETVPEGVRVEDCRRFIENLILWAIGG